MNYKKAKHKFVRERVYEFTISDRSTDIIITRTKKRVLYFNQDPQMEQLGNQLFHVPFHRAFWKAYYIAMASDGFWFSYEPKLKI